MYIFIHVCTYICILVSVQANIGSTITNILIINIIIQIPEGALLTCVPPPHLLRLPPNPPISAGAGGNRLL